MTTKQDRGAQLELGFDSGAVKQEEIPPVQFGSSVGVVISIDFRQPRQILSEGDVVDSVADQAALAAVLARAQRLPW